MEFSRAIAFACFTVTKWLALILAVLFAALAAQTFLEGDSSPGPVPVFVLSSLASFALCALMHWLAGRIGGERAS